MSEQDTNEPNVNQLQGTNEAPVNNESEKQTEGRRFRWDTMDTVMKWVPASAAVYGTVKWIFEIIRCFTDGAYRAQCSSCSRLFSVEFFSRYFTPAFLCLTGAVFFVCLAYGFVRFYRQAKIGKIIAVSVLLLVSAWIAVPILFKLLFARDAYRDNFPVFMLNVSGIVALIALGMAYFDKTVQSGFLLKSIVLWALLAYAGIPLLILLTQNAVLAVVVVITAVIVFFGVRSARKAPKPEPKYKEIPETGDEEHPMTEEQQSRAHRYNEAMRALNNTDWNTAYGILEELGEWDLFMRVLYDRLSECESQLKEKQANTIWYELLDYGDRYYERRRMGWFFRYQESYIQALAAFKKLIDDSDRIPVYWSNRDEKKRFLIYQDIVHSGIRTLVDRVRKSDPYADTSYMDYMKHGKKYACNRENAEKLLEKMLESSDFSADREVIAFIEIHTLSQIYLPESSDTSDQS